MVSHTSEGRVFLFCGASRHNILYWTSVKSEEIINPIVQLMMCEVKDLGATVRITVRQVNDIRVFLL